MSDFIKGFFAGIALVTIAIVIIDPDEVWQQSIVKNGHEEYNRTTGEFQFLPPCTRKTD